MLLSNILLLLLKLCHISILLFILLVPFTNNTILVFIHILFSILLLLHWYIQSDVCFLTYVEAIITGEDVNQGYIYKIISPFYNISRLKVKYMVWTVTILLLFISLYKFIKFIRENCKESIYKCIDNICNNNKFI